MSVMDKAALCRAISERLESVSQDIIAFPMVTVSPLGFWRGYGAVTGWKWGCVDFFNDESASARLLDAMPFGRLWKYKQPEGEALWWGCAYDHAHIDNNSHSPDRKTATVLAACKWLGIEGELEV